jgi:CTP:molybdopterin cytidylyltransferase MocA
MAQRSRRRVIGAVLAAGGGSRMGTPKGELVVDGERLLDRAVRALGTAGCETVLAVVRAGTEALNAQIVVNADPSRGLRSSLTLAVEAALAVEGAAGPGPSGHEPVVVGLAVLLADLPGVGADAIRPVIEAWRPGRIAVACYQGRRGHPIVMSPARWQEAIAVAAPDEGARRFLAAHPEWVDDVAVAGDPSDLDTPEDFRRWLAR